jgi:hypothetical protein
MLAYSMRSVTDMQLIQDKICKFNYNQTDHFCRKLSKIGQNENDSQQELDLKSTILVLVSKFHMYYLGLSFLPSVFVCLFIGSWCDRYIYGRKILLLVGAVGISMEDIIKIYMSVRFDLGMNFWFLVMKNYFLCHRFNLKELLVNRNEKKFRFNLEEKKKCCLAISLTSLSLLKVF